MPDLRLGILLWSQASGWPEMLEAARRIDRLGYDHLWTWDHLYAVMGDPYQPIFEGYSLLSAWAMATDRVKLGLLVGANTFRNPGLVAKIATTLDHISQGRAIVGMGGAWFELEHTAHGLQFGTGFGQRLDWLDESVGSIRKVLDGETVSSQPGAHYRFDDLRHHPRPVQPHMPIMIGGTGEKKTLRTVARYADSWNATGTPEFLKHKDEVLREHCLAVGRDERQITRTVDTCLLIRDSKKEALAAWESIMNRNKVPRDKWDGPEALWLGTAEEIADEIRSRIKVGFETLIVEMPAPYDPETLERLIGEVKPMVDAG